MTNEPGMTGQGGTDPDPKATAARKNTPPAAPAPSAPSPRAASRGAATPAPTTAQ